MKYVPGYMFKAKRDLRTFLKENTYRIYHISPLKDGVEYIFQSKNGNVKEKFDSTDKAEAVIDKISGK